jgi:hypothetical protein
MLSRQPCYRPVSWRDRPAKAEAGWRPSQPKTAAVERRSAHIAFCVFDPGSCGGDLSLRRQAGAQFAAPYRLPRFILHFLVIIGIARGEAQAALGTRAASRQTWGHLRPAGSAASSMIPAIDRRAQAVRRNSSRLPRRERGTCAAVRAALVSVVGVSTLGDEYRCQTTRDVRRTVDVGDTKCSRP